MMTESRTPKIVCSTCGKTCTEQDVTVIGNYEYKLTSLVTIRMTNVVKVESAPCGHIQIRNTQGGF